MKVQRFAAAFVAFVLIATISAAVISLEDQYANTTAHGTQVGHQNGKVLAFGPAKKTFTFRTSTGVVLHFICSGHCPTESQHIQRHITEKASTDVYYISNNQGLVAIDVD